MRNGDERTDERRVGDAVVRRPGEERGQVQPEEQAGDERLPDVPQGDPSRPVLHR